MEYGDTSKMDGSKFLMYFFFVNIIHYIGIVALNVRSLAQIPSMHMEIEYPSLSDRFQSIIIDQVFIVILMFSGAAILDKFNDAPDWVRIALFFGIWGDI
jgi:hypothetical protein